MAQPLAGMRVIDFTSAWAGPRLSSYLAELGAEVIHVESIQYLDAHRGWSKWGGGAYGLYPNDDTGKRPWERSSLFMALNKGKRGITLNLGDEAGRELFARLLATSDVLVENYRAGQLGKFGFDDDACRRICPDLVAVHLPAFGMSGPYRDWTAWGDQASAVAGIGLLLNYPGDDEPQVGSTYGDPVAAAVGAYATLAALRHRARTGEGQTVDLALAEGIIPLLPEQILEQSLAGRTPEAEGSSHRLFVPWGLFRCAGDDQWVSICVEHDSAFESLAKAMGKPELAGDASFATVLARRKNRAGVDAVVTEWTRTREPLEVADLLQAAGIPSEPVQTHASIFRDRQFIAREFWTTLDHPEAGPFTYVGAPARYSAGSVSLRRGAPLVGEDNARVLGGLLGASEEDLERLADARVIGDEPLEDNERKG